MTNRQGFLDYLFKVCQFTPEQKDVFLKNLHHAFVNQLVARGVLDQSTVAKLIATLREGSKKNPVQIDALLQVFSDEQKKNTEEIFNIICETLEDVFIANSTLEQKRQMLALLEQ